MEERITVAKLPEIRLSKSLALLKIQANQNDPVIFQSLFCATCQDFILANGLFPPPERHVPGHALAWVPALDEPVLGRPRPVMQEWLNTAGLSDERRRELAGFAYSSNSLCFALFLGGDEREAWFEYFSTYLDGLAEAWLQALNGEDTRRFRVEEIWVGPRPKLHFSWLPEVLTE